MSKYFTAVLVLSLITTQDRSAWGINTTLTQQGIVIHSGRGGQYTLTYPALGTAAKTLPPSKIAIQGRKLTARYRSGAVLSSELNDDGTMVFHFTALPDDVKTIRFDLPLSLALNRGGQFAIDGHAAAPFPATATADAFLFKGEARRLVITPARANRLPSRSSMAGNRCRTTGSGT